MRQVFFLILFSFFIVHGKTSRLRQQEKPCSSGDGPDCVYIPWKAAAIPFNHTI